MKRFIFIFIFVIVVLSCFFIYWCGGGNFERGEELKDLCVNSFILGCIISWFFS